MSKLHQILPSSNPVTPRNQKGKRAIRNATHAPSHPKSHPKDVGAQVDATDRHNYSIEYKVLFKFSASEIAPGLQGIISPEEEVINNNDTTSEATS